MTPAHRKLRRQIGAAIPHDWSWRLEGCGHWVDPTAKWRADVLASRDNCVVAFEAQLQYEGVESRSTILLKSGVWLIWVLPRIPWPHQALPLLTAADLPLIPEILAELHRQPDPTGLTWDAVQPTLRQAIAISRRALERTLREEPPEAPP